MRNVTDLLASRTGCAAILDEARPISADLVEHTACLLAGAGARVVTVHAAAGRALSLPELVAHIVHQAPPHAPTQDRLECAFDTLTQPGPGFSRVVLLVASAELLTREALEYLQLTCRSSPALQ